MEEGYEEQRKNYFFTKEDGIMYEVLKNMRNKSAMDLLKENGISLTPPNSF